MRFKNEPPAIHQSEEARFAVLARYRDAIGLFEDYFLQNSGSATAAGAQRQGTGKKTGQARQAKVGLGGAFGLSTRIGSSGAVWCPLGTTASPNQAVVHHQERNTRP